ncbi:cytochrome P450 monooxygenase [Gloeopeniophorella convolvens]|nr:cytochrome P450 monooxygenase [Gloeopeniophorella convolvens]
MALIEQVLDILRNANPALIIWTIPALVIVAHLLPWLIDAHGLRSYPGPWLAQFSDLWLGRVAQQGHRSEVVHELHKKYGPFVRIAPNHISISDPAALQTVYAHGNGSLKSNFYDAFVSITRGLFNTRDRAAHTRKRKIISHIFSQKNVLEFEPHVQQYLRLLLQQWDRLCAGGAKGLKGDDGEGGWRGRNGRVWLDCLPWYNYLAFDIIGDLAFGSPFGMLTAAKDSAPVAKSHQQAIATYGEEEMKYETVAIPAIKILNDRGEYSASIGVLPPWLRPIVKRYVPWYSKGGQAVENLAGLAVAAVAKRLASPAFRVDLLTKLQQGKDDDGNPMGKEELTAEALTQLIAGSDTTSNSSCATTYYLAANPEVQAKLQKELDDALENEDDSVSSYETVKNLPYLNAVINEALRLHSTSGIGLPRIVPEGGLIIKGQAFKEGAILSVPSYTIHRDTHVWGKDSTVFRPERWFERDDDAIQKAFNPFSYGPRACVGRNLATLELLIIISTVFRRYDVVLKHPEEELETREGFLRKPLMCYVGLKRRSL